MLLGVSNKHFPADAWGTMSGFAPSTPTRDFIPGPSKAIGPAPSSGTYSSYLTNNFPLKHEKKAPLYKGSWPVGPEGLSSPLQETRRNPLAKKIVTLRVGCATGARHHGPTAKCRPPDAKHPGKTAKKALEGTRFHQRLFSVFIVPVVLFFVSSTFMRKSFYLIRLYVALWVQGQCPWCGVEGPHRPLPSFGYRGYVSPCSIIHFYLAKMRTGSTRKVNALPSTGRIMQGETLELKHIFRFSSETLWMISVR